MSKKLPDYGLAKQKLKDVLFCQGLASGIKKNAKNDLALLLLPTCYAAAGLFTKNKFKAPSVVLSQAHLKEAVPKAILINSGCANAGMGEQGLDDAKEMIKHTAKGLGLLEEEVLLAQTGIIGTKMPMEQVSLGIQELVKSIRDKNILDWESCAQAMMTTDTTSKISSVSVGQDGLILGMTKGSGMIAPNMATTLSVLVTSIKLDSKGLQVALKEAMDQSYNRASVDTDTSTNDMVLLLSTGQVQLENQNHFNEALKGICFDLMKQLLLDAEGAEKMIVAHIKGAESQQVARCMAKAMIDSPLIKTMIAGKSPNWGRILMVLGKIAGELDSPLDTTRLWVAMNDTCLFQDGKGMLSPQDTLDFSKDTVSVVVDLKAGHFESKAYGCDMHEAYVTINKDKN